MQHSGPDIDARNERVQTICLQLTELGPLSRAESRTLDILLTQLETLAKRAKEPSLVRTVGGVALRRANGDNAPASNAMSGGPLAAAGAPAIQPA